jgi:hypothetical protein
MDESNESEDIVEKVLHFMHDNPGCHLRWIKRAMGTFNGNSSISILQIILKRYCRFYSVFYSLRCPGAPNKIDGSDS